ncbi:hypothetical protein [Algoriphagus vanfongensis]|nr:hypothetical protein [Algoriphagus vanfongensis]
MKNWLLVGCLGSSYSVLVADVKIPETLEGQCIMVFPQLFISVPYV